MKSPYEERQFHIAEALRERRSGRRGFSSVYLVIIMSSLLALILVLIEAAAGFAAGSIAENYCLISGRSVLSEFQPRLYDRYGILALRADENRLSKLAGFYLGEAADMSAGLVNIVPDSISADSSSYRADDLRLFEDQIAEISKYIVVKNALDAAGISSLIEDIVSGKAAESYDASDTLDELDELSKAPKTPADGSPEEGPDAEKQKREQARKLRNQYKNAFRSYGRPDGNGMLERLADYVAGDMFCVEYAMRMFSNRYSMFTDTVLRYESEYLLFGGSTDAVNERAMRSALFIFRFTINLAGILSDPAEMARINSEAATVYFLLPTSLVVAVLTAVRAARLSAEHLNMLLAGEKVPILKGVDFGTYADYLRLFLYTVPKDTLLRRMMNVMEQNVAEEDGADFSFRSYCYGFELSAEFNKATHLPDFMGINGRRGRVVQKHAYLQTW